MRAAWYLASAMALVAAPAWAGETPLYQPPPAWVEPADLAAASAKKSGSLVIYDVQERIEGDRLTSYLDQAIRLDTPQALTQFGTLAASWSPDKGDLVIHRAQLVRGSEQIDLLTGETFAVLRREEGLEQRIFTGTLTATLAVPGARVGDIVRLSYSVTNADAALAGNVQRLGILPASDDPIGLGRVVVTWPKERAVRFSAGPRVKPPVAVDAGAMTRLEIVLPLPKPEEMPHDAPPRFRMPPVLGVTTFAGWSDLSRAMAPLYATTGAIPANGPLAAEVVKIAEANSDPETRIAAALRLVQDEIAYFLNGMNGGNYVPQSPAQTWQERYGDCKAKSLLLVAILRELGIAAEPALVNSRMGDVVGELLPMAAAFDHVIVRAEAGGKEYWLDGTSAGTRLASLGDVPPFRYGLPLREPGAGLIELPARAPALPEATIVATHDLTAGIDLPALYDVRIELAGPAAAQIDQLARAPSGEQRDGAIDGLVTAMVGDSQVIERAVIYDAASGVGTITAKGFGEPPWNLDERRARLTLDLPSASIEWRPDRGRAAWRAIPVNTGRPGHIKVAHTFLLPSEGRGITIQGGSFEGEVAGKRVSREARLEGGRLTIVESVMTHGGEISAERIAAERANRAALVAAAPVVRAAEGEKRAWDIAGPDHRVRLKALYDAYAKAIEAKPDDADILYGRAAFLSQLRDFPAALRDLDKAVSLDPSAEAFAYRADFRVTAGDMTGAIADLRKAHELDPVAGRLAVLAHTLGQAGWAAEALALVEPAVERAGEERPRLVTVQAELMARLGRKDEGLALLDALLTDRPGDASLLNARCWYRAVWSHALGEARRDCNRAVEGLEFSPPALDSRALATFRLDQLESALADAEAALERAPGQVQTLLLRGVIRQKMGDAGGQQDIAAALRRSPGLALEYKGYGLLP